MINNLLTRPKIKLVLESVNIFEVFLMQNDIENKKYIASKLLIQNPFISSGNFVSISGSIYLLLKKILRVGISK